MPDQYVVPPPPPDSPLEVVIRTLSSDIELLKKNGGNASGFSGPSVTVPRGSATSSTEGNSSSAIVWLLIFAVGAVILFFIGYYGIPFITNSITPATTGGIPVKGVVTQKTQTTGPEKSAEPAFFGHTSFFKTAPDATKDFDPYRTATGPVDHAFILKTIDSLTGTADTFTELTTKSSEGRPLLWGELAGLLGAPELDKDVFKNIFARDFTFFVWRDKAGMWPGFVFKLKDDMSPLLVQKQILGIETPTSNFKGLFLVPVDAPASSFADTQMSGQPTRSLLFAKPKAAFIYGWFFKDYMVMSTSEEGLRRAIVSL